MQGLNKRFYNGILPNWIKETKLYDKWADYTYGDESDNENNHLFFEFDDYY